MYIANFKWLALAVLALLLASPASAWWNTSFTNRTEIQVNATANVTDYQLLVYIPYELEMQTDFDDLRIVNKDDNISLPYFIESKVNSQYAKVWFKGNWTTNNGTQAYAYFGNSTESSQSSLNATFWAANVFTTDYAPFLANTSGTATWTLTGGKMKLFEDSNDDAGLLSSPALPSDKKFYITTKVNNTACPSGSMQPLMISNRSTVTTDTIWRYKYPTLMEVGCGSPYAIIAIYANSTGTLFYYNSSTGIWDTNSANTLVASTSQNVFYTYSIYSNGTHFKMKVDNTETTWVSWGDTNNNASTLYASSGEMWTDYYYVISEVDYFMIRNYTTPEPTTSVAAYPIFASCTGTDFSVALNITLWNEVTRTPVNGSVDVWIYPDNHIYSFDFNDAYYFPVCIYPSVSSKTIDATLDYSATGFSNRAYYLDDATLSSNTTQTLNLMLLNSSASTLLQVYVQDNVANKLTDVIVKFVRYYAGTPGDYEYATMVKTDTNGEGNTYVVMYDDLYAIIIQNGTTVLYEQGPASIAQSPITYVVTMAGTENLYNTVYGLAYDVTYTNATQTLRFVVTDGTGLMTSATLRVYNQTALGDTLVCNDTDTGTVIVMTCTISNTTNLRYLAKAWVTLLGVDYLVYSNYFDWSVPPTGGGTYGLEGVLYTFFIVGVLSTIGLVISPIVMPILALVGLGVSAFMGFLILPQTQLVALVVVASIVVFMVTRGRS